MAKIIAICGKICSGKSFYAKKLKMQNNAVILSTDEMTYDLINNEQDDNYNIFANKCNMYLLKKAVEIAQAGANVILDWGFWQKHERIKITEYCKNHNVKIEWHYINISDESWLKNIDERNAKVEAGLGGFDFYVDEGLKRKMQMLWEEPSTDEIDIRYNLKR